MTGKKSALQAAAEYYEEKCKALEAENVKLREIRDAYAESARVIAVWLDEFCDKDLSYDKMIAEAARRASKRIDELQGELNNPIRTGVCEACVEKSVLRADELREALESIVNANDGIEREANKPILSRSTAPWVQYIEAIKIARATLKDGE